MTLVILVFCVLVCFLLKNFLSKSNEADKNFDKIPGPKGLPIVGNIGDLFYSNEKRWHRIRSRSRKYPIYKMKFFNLKMVHLADPVDVEVILSDSTITKGAFYQPLRFWLGQGILMSGGETWRRGRKLLTKSFHFGALSDYISTFNNEVNCLLKLIEEENGKSVKLSPFLNISSLKIVLYTISGEKLGSKSSLLNSFLSAIDTMGTITAYKMTLPLMNILYKFTYLKKREDKALKVFSDFGSRVIEKNRCLINDEDEKKSTMVDILLKNFDDQRVQDEIKTFLFAGYDTTSTSLDFILYTLASKPYYQEEILKEIEGTTGNDDLTYGKINEMNLLDRFIKECLRLYSVVVFIGRTLHKDVHTPSGYTIPAGTAIFIHIFDIHRNPKFYPNPDEFDPDRFLPENVRKRHAFSYIPFSAGPRNCIAQKFAMLELKTVVCGILKKYRMKAIGSLEDIVFVPDIVLKSKYPLKVQLIPRSSS